MIETNIFHIRREFKREREIFPETVFFKKTSLLVRNLNDTQIAPRGANNDNAKQCDSLEVLPETAIFLF